MARKRRNEKQRKRGKIGKRKVVKKRKKIKFFGTTIDKIYKEITGLF